MNAAGTMATAEAAFAIESECSPAIVALCVAAPKDVIRMAWMLGYCSGRRDAFGEASQMVDAISFSGPKAVSTGPGDLDTCGRELKPGT